MNDYQKQANDFASKYGVKLAILSQDYKPMWGETTARAVYKCRLSRNGKSYTFEFGASLMDPSRPKIYDILACVQKWDTGSFEEFCGEFGYNNLPLSEYPRIKKTYDAVCREYNAIRRLFPEDEVLRELQDIC